MKTKMKTIMITAIAVISFTSCNCQTTASASTDKTKSSCSKKCSTKKGNNKMTTNDSTCSNCGKNSCDAACNTSSTTEGGKLKASVPSCNLSESELVERKANLSNPFSIFSKVSRTIELKNGYDFVFNEPKEFSEELLNFINSERACCSNFSFALEFEPNEKATHLKIFGSKAIKKEIKQGFMELGILQAQ